MLQAYALQRFLDNHQILNETVCVNGFAKELKKRKLKYFIKNFFSFEIIKNKWGFVVLAFHKLWNKKLKKNIEIRNVKFKQFEKTFFHLSPQYNSFRELSKAMKNYDAVLVGSDQLWLPSNIEADYYTLNFVPDHILKIAYATSFGVEDLPLTQRKSAEIFLSRIDYISVRERSGQKLVKKITGRNIPVVCDPTLLLSGEEWSAIYGKKRIVKGKYIFCYFLGKNPEALDFVKQLKKFTKLKIVALQQIDCYIANAENNADEVLYEVDPLDFVSLVANAEYVCTDSFHGTVFSILNEKIFFTFRRFIKHTNVSTNHRLDSLLDILGLKDRIIENRTSVLQVLERVIDYPKVNMKLEEFRADSINFLLTSLEGMKNVTNNG